MYATTPLDVVSSSSSSSSPYSGSGSSSSSSSFDAAASAASSPQKSFSTGSEAQWRDEYLFIGTTDGNVLKYAVISLVNMLGDVELELKLLESYAVAQQQQGLRAKASSQQRIQRLLCDDELGLLFIQYNDKLEMIKYFDYGSAIRARHEQLFRQQQQERAARGLMPTSSRSRDDLDWTLQHDAESLLNTRSRTTYSANSTLFPGDVPLSSQRSVVIKEAAHLNTFCLDQKAIALGKKALGASFLDRSVSQRRLKSFAHRLCVSVKKKLLFFQYTHDSYVFLEEHHIPEPCADLVFYGQSLCIGTRREYTLIRLQNSAAVVKSENSSSSQQQSGAGAGKDQEQPTTSESFAMKKLGGLLKTAATAVPNPVNLVTRKQGKGAPAQQNQQGPSAVVVLQSTQVSNVSTILELDKNMRPLVALMDNEAILRRNNLCVFVDIETGAPTLRNSIVWSDVPLDLAVCFPYIVAQLPRDKLEVYNLYETSQVTVETHSFPTSDSAADMGTGSSGVFGNLLNLGQGDALASIPSIFALQTTSQSGTRRGVFLFQNRTVPSSVHMLQPIAFDKQVRQLIRKCRCEEAFELFEKTAQVSLNSSPAVLNQRLSPFLRMKLQQMYEDSGYVLLVNADSDLQLAREAFEHYFEQCTSQTLDMKQLLGYFFPQEPEPSDDFASLEVGEAAQEQQPEDEEPPLLTVFFRNLKAKHVTHGDKFATLDSSTLDAIMRQATEQFESVKSDFLMPFLERKRKKLLDELKQLELRQQMAVQMLSSNQQQQRQYSAGIAMKLQEQLSFIDNALVQLYVAVPASGASAGAVEAVSPLEQLLRQKPLFCDLKMAKQALQKAQDPFYLALLYRAHGLVAEALQLLKDMLEQRTQANSDPVRTQKAQEELISILSSIDKMEHKYLLFKYGKWAISRDPEQAVRIFMKPREQLASAQQQSVVRPEEVLLFLVREFGSGASEATAPNSRELLLMSGSGGQPEWLRRFIMQYLEYLIIDLKSKESQFHSQLAVLYIEDLLRWKKLRSSSRSAVTPTTDQSSNQYPLTGSYDDLRSKLLIHLERSQFYHFESIAARLQATDLHEERIIVYRKMGLHEEALKIILFSIRDFKTAETYCLMTAAQAGRDLAAAVTVRSGGSGEALSPTTKQPSTPQQQQQQFDDGLPTTQFINGDNYLSNPLRSRLFLQLLDLCFHIPPNLVMAISASERQRYKRFALDMLNVHANKINPLSALLLLPADICTQDLALFLSRSTHESEQHTKSIALVKNMSKNERLQVEYELNCITKERRAQLRQNHRCGVCAKRILPQSAKAIFPDNSIFHLSCVRADMNVHPITRRDFRVEPVDRLYYQTVRQDGQQKVVVRPDSTY